MKKDPKQISLDFDRKESYLERKVSQNKSFNLEDIKIPRLWDIRRKDLELLSYDALERFFYGLHNLEIPFEMLDSMNPDEIYAKYMAAGDMKRYNKHLEIGFKTANIKFDDLYKNMDRIGYSFIKNVGNRCKRRFSSKTGEQEKRFSTLSLDTREAFVRSFFEPYKASDREQPDNFVFIDPNRDGKNKRLYVDRIYSIIKSMWGIRIS